MALSAALVHQLNKLARVSLADVPLVPLPRALDALDPRMCQQRSEQWFHQRRGHLTASRFHHALGFGSPLQRREALNALAGADRAARGDKEEDELSDEDEDVLRYGTE